MCSGVCSPESRDSVVNTLRLQRRELIREQQAAGLPVDMIGWELNLSPACRGIVPVLIDPSTARSSLSAFIPTIERQHNSQVFHSDSLLFSAQLKIGCSVVVLFQLRREQDPISADSPVICPL